MSEGLLNMSGLKIDNCYSIILNNEEYYLGIIDKDTGFDCFDNETYNLFRLFINFVISLSKKT
jgi:hypothetical protein